jgi:hypothetical protein
MNSAKIKCRLARLVDFTAALTFIYPPSVILWFDHENLTGPAGLREKLLCAPMVLALPSLIWFWWRQLSDPPGTHPILDKFVKDRNFLFVCVFVSGAIMFVIRAVIHFMR